MIKLFLSSIVVVCLLLGSPLYAANNTSCKNDKPYKIEYPDTLNKAGLWLVAGTHVGLYAGTLWYLNDIWYKDRAAVPFHFYNDNAGYLQIDKFGHATTAYHESRISYYSFRKVGMSRNKALIYGGSMGFLMQLPIEIFDGLNEGWGFSWGDIAANTFGSALMAGQEYFFDEQIVTMKFSYGPTVYADMANGYLGSTPLESISDDYNGHTYWFSGNIKRMTNQSFLPDWLNLAVGYSAGGMFGEFENITEYRGVPIPETQRYRQLFLSLDVDWTRIPTNSKFMELLFQGLNIIKVPFPAIQFNTKGEVHGHWLYF
jgi:YHS domain-containing protein